MKVVHLSTTDQLGGAARAAHRLHRSLLSSGCDSTLVVRQQSDSDPRTQRILPSTWSNEARLLLSDAGLKALLYRLRADEAFDPDLRLFAAPSRALVAAASGADIVHLHWMRGLVATSQLGALAEGGRSLVWTLMDLAALTGGCHYTHGCMAYTARCGRCPRLRSTRERDLSRWTHDRRRRAYAGLPLTVVACNRWTAERVRASTLLADVRCEVIPLAIDTSVFAPVPQAVARQALGLPIEGTLVFCGALNMGQARKGIADLAEALRLLPSLLGAQGIEPQGVAVVTAGNGASIPDLDFRQWHLGMLGDDRSLALAYSAADVFVSPSVEDAGPMMVNEAMACGVPVVATAVGTAPDFIRDGETGWLAGAHDPSGLARGLAAVLQADDRDGFRDRCRRVAVERFAPAVVAAAYMQLYRDLRSP